MNGGEPVCSQLNADLLARSADRDRVIARAGHLVRSRKGEIAPGVVADRRSHAEIAVLAGPTRAADVGRAEAEDQTIRVIAAGRPVRRVGTQRHETEGYRCAGYRVATAVDAEERIGKLERG